MLMVVNKRNSVDGLALNNRSIPDGSHVEIASSISRLFKFIVQGNVKEAELDFLQKIQVSVPAGSDRKMKECYGPVCRDHRHTSIDRQWSISRTRQAQKVVAWLFQRGPL